MRRFVVTIDVRDDLAVDVGVDGLLSAARLLIEERAGVRFVKDFVGGNIVAVVIDDLLGPRLERLAVGVAAVGGGSVVDVFEAVGGIDVGQDAGAQHRQYLDTVLGRQGVDKPIVFGVVNPTRSLRLVILGVKFDAHPARAEGRHALHDAFVEELIDAVGIVGRIGIVLIPGILADDAEKVMRIGGIAGGQHSRGRAQQERER